MMNRRWSGHILAGVCAVALAAGELAAAPEPLTVDDVLERMSKKAASVKDLRATVRKTQWASFEEEKYLFRLELFYRKPDLERVDVYKKRDGKEVHTQQVIVGKDFVLKLWPDQGTGERQWVDPKEMKRRREDRSDPLTFFSRRPDDLKKDFNVELRGPEKRDTVGLVIAPRSKKVRFDYKSLELVVDTKTWMPTSIKATSKDDEDWSLYEFEKVKVNSGLTDADFQPVKGIKIEEREAKTPEKGNPEAQQHKPAEPKKK